MKFKVGDRIIYKGGNSGFDSFVLPYSIGTVTRINAQIGDGVVSCDNWTPHHPNYQSDSNFWVPIENAELAQSYLNETTMRKLLGVEK